ncbi:hypothetical protein M430DRAFT_32988 [Amorphotheca resinae ATCC 22711]|jgi:formate/nitrite transporter|uniref:Formate/nitrite transporter n=1 Tax=Amorphotheca resinae ATCC 22711 TaxID=857342 RepID=A0A2T3BA96_AMORE|nr:hypothetical protein M430DRAFT_32988 [Amorphotheca resinae ATCC 22711]PSS25194.1 hypothetical protein M430DRAFT_32988 [Amorphotheca resinae ATCC 22711]
MDSLQGRTPLEIGRLITKSTIVKAKLSWADLVLKSFLGGIFISMGALFDLSILGGMPGLRASNPMLATFIAGFTFPTGFFLIIYTNSELVTSNMFTMMYSALQRRITPYDVARSWIVSYVFNFAGALFFAGFLTWWTDTLSLDVQKAYAVTQAETRVLVPSYWSVNFLRGVGCNWIVGLAFWCSTAATNEHVAKIYAIWIPIWAFVGYGYQHCVANYFLIPIGMFYGTSFGVGEFIYKSCIPVTLGNIFGGAGLAAFAFWFLYGREEDPNNGMIAVNKFDGNQDAAQAPNGMGQGHQSYVRENLV